MKGNKIKLKSKSGFSMVVVVIILTVLMILGALLLDASTQNLRKTKHERGNEFACFTSESVVELVFDSIFEKCKTINKKYTGNVDTYSKELEKELNDSTGVYKDLIGQYINTPNYSASSTARQPIIKDIKLTTENGHFDTTNKSLFKFTVGIVVTSQYENTLLGASNGQVYAKKEFEVTVPSGFFLNCAVYSLNGLLVEGTDAEIVGNVNVFGCGPDNPRTPKQDYYEGVYTRNHINSYNAAKKNPANLKVIGNVYTRGLVRTGKYLDDDTSEIRIAGDVIANSVHIFGNQGKIYVYKNAYTFDDLEVNSLQSLLFVRGNFFGLSCGDTYHDQSSAIVNSAPIHNPDDASKDRAKESRIMVNGMTFINGGTFRIKPEGDTNEGHPYFMGKTGGTKGYETECGSTAWNNSTDFDMAAYKEYTEGDLGTPYNEWLYKKYKDNPGEIRGNGIIIQPRYSKELESELSKYILGNTDYDEAVDKWIGDYITSKEESQYKDDADNIGPIDSYGNSIGIKGYFNYSVAANHKIYFNKLIKPVTDIEKDIEEATRSDFNNIEIEDITKLPGTKADIGSIWDDMNDPNFNYLNPSLGSGQYNMRIILNKLKIMLVPFPEIFASRVIPDEHKDEMVNFATDCVRDTSSGNPIKSKFEDLKDRLWTHIRGSGHEIPYTTPTSVAATPKPTSVAATPKPTSTASALSGKYGILIDINNRAKYTGSLSETKFNPIEYLAGNNWGNKYFVLIVDDPAVELDFSTSGGVSNFNGIVFTMGKVNINPGVTINGSIIAAGKGEVNEYGEETSAAELKKDVHGNKTDIINVPAINAGNLDKMDNGDYTGVHFKCIDIDGGPDVTNSKPATSYFTKDTSRIIFPGRDALLSKFNDSGLYSIF